MKKVCGLEFRFSREKEEIVIAELKCVAVLENANKRRAWIYEIDGKAFLIIYEAEAFNSHKKYHIVAEKVGEPPGSLIKWGVVKIFENQVLTIDDEDGVGEFVKKLLKRDWSIRFPSGSQVKAGY
jgi:hypothetical protein